MVYLKLGAAGEAVCVLAVNAMFGALLTLAVRFGFNKHRNAPSKE